MHRRRAAGIAPGALTIDVDSTICEVTGKQKQGAAFGYTHVLGYHPLLATIAGTGEILHGRLRKGSANTQRGTTRFVNELVARDADRPLHLAEAPHIAEHPARRANCRRCVHFDIG